MDNNKNHTENLIPMSYAKCFSVINIQGGYSWVINYAYCSLLVFPDGSVVKNLPANAGDADSIPGLGRSPEEGNGNPVHYPCLGTPMDRRPDGLQST